MNSPALIIVMFVLMGISSTALPGGNGSGEVAGKLSFDDLVSAAQAAQASIISGSITYEYMEYIAERPDRELPPDYDAKEAAYMRGPRENKALCTLQFKREGDDTVWRLSRVNTRDLSAFSSEEIRRWGVDYNSVHAFDGQSHYNLLSADHGTRPHLLVGDGSIPHRYLIEDAGFPSLFKSHYVTDSTNAELDYRTIQTDGELVRVSNYKSGVLSSTATLSLEYEGRSLEEVSYMSFVAVSMSDNHKEFYSLPNGHRTFSDYQQVSGIWYPMHIYEEHYRPDPEILKGMKLSSRIEINVLSCAFNIPVDDSLFTMVPQSGVRVRDDRYGVEYIAQ